MHSFQAVSQSGAARNERKDLGWSLHRFFEHLPLTLVVADVTHRRVRVGAVVAAASLPA